MRTGGCGGLQRPECPSDTVPGGFGRNSQKNMLVINGAVPFRNLQGESLGSRYLPCERAGRVSITPATGNPFPGFTVPTSMWQLPLAATIPDSRTPRPGAQVAQGRSANAG